MFRYYVAHTQGKRFLLKWRGIPTRETTGFPYLTGPFKTKRGALWAVNNPFGWSIVSEAETWARLANDN